MYKFYFDKDILPVTPGAITTTFKNQNKTITLINEGEVNLIKQAGLTEYSFKFMLPWCNYPFVNMNYPQLLTDAIPSVHDVLAGKWKLSNVETFFKSFNLQNFIMGGDEKLGIFPSQDEWLTKLSKYKTEKTVFRFKIQRIDGGLSLDKLPISNNIDLSGWTMRTGHVQFKGWTTDVMCTLEDVKISEEAKEYKDVWVEVKLKEFIPYGTKFFEEKDGKLVEKGSVESEAKATADITNAQQTVLGKERAESLREQAHRVGEQSMQDLRNSRKEALNQAVKRESA